MATYHNPSSDLRKKVAKKTMKPCSTLLRGFYYVKGYLMDLIYQAAAKYVALQQYEYEFVLSHRRKTRNIKISFFKKENIAYGGDILYWMMKTKHNIFTDKNIILYKHPNYSKEE